MFPFPPLELVTNCDSKVHLRAYSDTSFGTNEKLLQDNSDLTIIDRNSQLSCLLKVIHLTMHE